MDKFMYTNICTNICTDIWREMYTEGSASLEIASYTGHLSPVLALRIISTKSTNNHSRLWSQVFLT